MKQALLDGKLEPGLTALVEANNLEPEKLTAYSFGFVISKPIYLYRKCFD